MRSSAACFFFVISSSVSVIFVFNFCISSVNAACLSSIFCIANLSFWGLLFIFSLKSARFCFKFVRFEDFFRFSSVSCSLFFSLLPKIFLNIFS